MLADKELEELEELDKLEELEVSDGLKDLDDLDDLDDLEDFAFCFEFLLVLSFILAKYLNSVFSPGAIGDVGISLDHCVNVKVFLVCHLT